MSEEIKPCPFCGGANQEEYTRQEHASPTQHYIRCADCCAMALGDTWNARDSEAKACAIKAWNTRSEQAAKQMIPREEIEKFILESKEVINSKASDTFERGYDSGLSMAVLKLEELLKETE